MNSTAITIKVDLPRPAFHLQVEVAIPGQGITAVFGPSGCGKTSLLRAIAGLEDAELTKQHSHIQVNGTVWFSATQQLPTHQRKVGFVFQEASLFEHLTVQKNLAYGFKRNQPSRADIDERVKVDELIALLELAPLLERSTSHLSGGERQRVALARAVLASPTLLLMDEPLAALDQQRKQEIVPYLERLQQYLAIPVIYVSHALDEIVQLADHLLLMDKGKIVAAGALTDLLSEHPLLAHREDAFTLLQGTVTDINSAHHLTCVSFGTTTVFLPQLHAAQHQPVRLRVYARDVSLCLDYPQRTSILNILPARITQIEAGDRGQNLVRLAIEDQVLLARISHLSCYQLGLAVGQHVYAQIKALALMK
jgi:molybdate transport system ATP-binding protein